MNRAKKAELTLAYLHGYNKGLGELQMMVRALIEMQSERDSERVVRAIKETLDEQSAMKRYIKKLEKTIREMEG